MALFHDRKKLLYGCDDFFRDGLSASVDKIPVWLQNQMADTQLHQLSRHFSGIVGIEEKRIDGTAQFKILSRIQNPDKGVFCTLSITTAGNEFILIERSLDIQSDPFNQRKDL